MAVVGLTLSALLEVCGRLDPAGREEQAALAWDGRYDPEAVAARIWSACQAGGIGFVLVDGDGVPRAAGGFLFPRPGVAVTWMLVAEGIGRHAVELTRHARRAMRALLEGGEVRRIETYSAASHEAAHRWFRTLGLRREAELPAYSNGVDFVLFAAVAGQTSDEGEG